ncbi:AhpC/TSA family protein [Flavobacterium zepuense]|uniref:AhpC/TSA family protein n=1 Tax=Flavobacterium zepuense TaxID=2593302 RepID=A0A552VA64_9FLAO|nr:TlpA disulfide reductase family protein [Flavobacterium zepuense]TRW27377.1 AhpC/TSA family protein [Flavobacterium zepuense]
MKILSWLPLLLFYSVALQAQSNITIKGNIINDLEGYDEIYFKYKGEPLDTVKVVNGNFVIIMPFRKDDMPWIYDEYTLKKLGERPFGLMAEHPGTIVLNDIDVRSFSFRISGMQSAIDYEEFNTLSQSTHTDIVKELQKKYPVTPEYTRGGDVSSEYRAYNNDYIELFNKYTVIVLEKFIKNHPDSFAAVRVLKWNMEGMDAETIKKYYALLSKKRQNSDEGKEIVTFINALKSSAVNNQIKDFVLLGPDGKNVSTKSLRGKYVLIDFWASWCGPCVAEFPNIKELYGKYKNENFEILSVSIDKSSKAWLNALEKHQLPWLQVRDEKNSEAYNFAVSAVPVKILIDPKGKIIMRDGDIEKKLSELFGVR